jgi:hypothetical protein
MVFVKNDSNLSSRRLKKMKLFAVSVIRKIESRLNLPKRVLIDWTLSTDMWDAKPVLFVTSHWYRIQRPQDKNGRRCSEVFAIQENDLCTCLAVDCSIFLFSASENEVIEHTIKEMEG